MLSDREFEDYVTRRRIQARGVIRAGFLAGLAFNMLFLLFDAWAGLSLSHTLPLRGMWSVVLLGGALATYFPRSHDGYAWIVGIAGATGAWTMAHVMVLDSVPTRHVPGLVTLFIAAVGMAPTIRSAGFTIAALVAVPLLVLLTAGWPLPMVLEAGAFLVMAAAMCALVCHLLERSQLRAFRLERELEQKATTDALTGLANRRHFFERTEAELARRARSGVALAVLMLDVDHFKRINDCWGHDVGDHVLEAVAVQLKRCARETDILARTGGEEFALLAVDASLGDAVEIGERMRAAMGDIEITVGESSVPVTVSIGCTIVRDDEADIAPALRRADEALYQAKRDGRDRVIAASERAEVRRATPEEGGHRFL